MKKISILLILMQVSVVVSAYDFMSDGIGDESENKNIALKDGDVFENSTRIDGVNISYTRHFSNTYWQALYIPFSIFYKDWKDDFDVAEISNFHERDKDGDGVVDETKLEVFYVKSGMTQPNCPYLIRAKVTGEKIIAVTGATLYPSEENFIDCASLKNKYIFTGTYHGVSGQDMRSNEYYALSNGGLSKASSDNAALGTFRWYLKTEWHDMYDIVHNASRAMVFNIKVIGEDDDTEATGIAEKASDYNHLTEYYRLNGTRVSNPTSSGVLILKDSNGRTKIIIKTRR